MKDFNEENNSMFKANNQDGENANYDDKVNENADQDNGEYIDGANGQYDENGEYIANEYDENGEYIGNEYDENGEYVGNEYDENGEYIGNEYDENGEYIGNEYDDRLNQVMGELAELRRSINAPVLAPRATYPIAQSAQFSYPNGGLQQNSGNDVSMYNEISRLRDELSRSQNSQSLHVELSRLKEDMAKETKQNEAALLEEIKKLNERVEFIGSPKKKQNPSSPVVNAPEQNGGISAEEFNKLINVCEAILRSNKDLNQKLQSEVASIKSKLAGISNFDELNANIRDMKTTIKNGANDKNILELSAELYELRKSLKEAVTQPGNSTAQAKISEKLYSINSLLDGNEVDNSEVLRQLYEVKSVVGNPSKALERRNFKALSLFNELNRLKLEIHSNNNESFDDKLNAIYKFVQELENNQDSDIAAIVAATDSLISDIKNATLTLGAFDSLVSYSKTSENIKINSDKRESVVQFIAAIEKVSKENVSSIIDFLPDVILSRNEIQNYERETENEEIFADIMTLNTDLMFATEDKAKAELSNKINEKVSSLTTLTMGDVAIFASVKNLLNEDENGISSAILTEIQSEEINAANQTIFAELSEIKEKLNAQLQKSSGENEPTNANILESIKAVRELVNNISTKTSSLLFSQGASDVKLISQNIEKEVNLANATLKDNHNSIINVLYSIKQKLDLEKENKQGKVDSNDVFTLLKQFALLEQTNKETSDRIFTKLEDVKEQIHVKELQNNLDTITASEEEQQTLIKEIIQVRERLAGMENSTRAMTDANAAQLKDISEKIEGVKANNSEQGYVLPNDFDSNFAKIMDDLKYLRNQVESTIGESSDDETLSAASYDDNSQIMLELSGIKEKLNSLEDYDTVTEILALREDVKAVRILDQGDVSEELEGVKLELKGIKGEISDIKTLREDITRYRAEVTTRTSDVASTTYGPTNDEVNVLLNEIVALRDEVQSYKDDMTKLVTVSPTDKSVDVTPSEENCNLLLDEISAIRRKISESEDVDQSFKTQIDDLKNNIIDIKDIVSSRNTTIVEETAATANQDETAVTTDDLYNEVLALKDIVSAQTKTKDIAANDDDSLSLAKQSLMEEMQAFKDELYGVFSDKVNEITSLTPQIALSLQNISEQVANNVSNQDVVNEIAQLKTQLNEIQAKESGQNVSNNEANSTLSSDIINEIRGLKDEIAAIKNDEPSKNNDIIFELLGLKNEISDMLGAVSQNNQTNYDSSISDLRQEMSDLREQIAASSRDNNGDLMVLNEVMSLREELTAIKEQINKPSINTTESSFVTGELANIKEGLATLAEMNNNDMLSDASVNVLSEVMALREDIDSLKASVNSANSSSDIMDTMESIKQDVRVIKDEPDLSIISEVLALRDEFQGFKEELEKKNSAANNYAANVKTENEKSSAELLKQLTSLRDQLFAISMASVNDGTNADATYESYNNIILDEINSLREELAEMKKADKTEELANEISQIKNTVTNLAVDEREKLLAQITELKKLVLKDN